jgi:fimbrial chaperone protein
MFVLSTSLTRRALATLAGAVLFVGVGASPALAQFSVDKTRVLLTGRAQSSLVRITNDSNQPMRFDVKIFAWDHSEAGEELLTATTEAVAAPGAVTIGPKESQNVRVGSTAQVGARERTYRLIIEELPQPRSAASGASVAMRMRLSIPVFLEPAKGEAVLDLGVPAMANRMPSVIARNIGTVHLQVDSVKFRGVGANGQAAFTVEQGGAYILPGKSLRITAPSAVTAAQCRAAAKVFVDVVVHGDTVTHEAPVASSVCGG